MLEPLGPQLWLCDGPAINALAGFYYPTRMAILQLDCGSLAVWSPVALPPALRAEIDALGPVAHLIAPNHLHHLSLPQWISAYPNAQVHGAPGLAHKRTDLDFDSTLGAEAPAAWAGQIDQVLLHGNKITTEVVFFHRASGTVLFTDFLQHLPKGWFRGWRAVVARLDLMTGADPAVPRKFRLAQTDRHAAREAVSHMQGWPVTQIVMAHGAPVTQDAPAILRRAFAWL